MARDPRTHHSRALLLVLMLAPLADCKCIEHPLYDAEVNRFDTWYLGGGNTQYRPFRAGEVPRDTTLEVELALDHGSDEGVVVRALVVEAVDREDLVGELLLDGHPIAQFEALDDEQLVARMPAIRGQHPELHAVFDDGHGARLDIRIAPQELSEALAELDADPEIRP
ncbi:MAG: hypothetical protein IAG13_26255 [Deltaproteobacteria bacterium]|nr:hypothetical protein [Nannocystaceae bacterium]